MKRKTKWLALLALYSTSLLYYLFQGGRSSILLFGILNALLLYLLLYYVLGMRKLTGARQIGESNQHDKQYMAGQKIAVQVRLQHSSLIPMPYMKLEEQLVRHDGTVQHMQGTVIPNVFREVEWTYSFDQLKRGIYQFSPLACSTFDVFGLIEYKRTIDSPDQFQVLPRLMSDVNWEQLLSGNKGRYHLHSHDRMAKESNQQSGIRDYVYGDRLSRVHWNATARTGHWKSKDYEKEAMPKGIVMLDRYRPLGAADKARDDDSFEALVSIAASLLQYGMQQQQLFALLSPGKELWSSSSFYGTAAYWQSMKHLVTVEPDSERPLSLLLQRAMLDLPLGSTLMIVTADASSEMAAAAALLKQKGFSPIIFYTKGQRKEQAHDSGMRALAYSGIPFHDLSAHAQMLKAAGGEG